MFVDFLREHLLGEPDMTDADRDSITRDLDRILNFLPVEECSDVSEFDLLPYTEDDLYDRLSSHVVRYCRKHPDLIPRDLDPRQYR